MKMRMLLIAVIFLYGCPNNLNHGVNNEITDTTAAQNVGEQNNNLKLLAGAKSHYYRFDKAHFEKSLQESKIIFLDFHADWCQICQSEKPGILAAFNELNNENVVGYQVHYNDKQTTENDKEMAKYNSCLLVISKIE